MLGRPTNTVGLAGASGGLARPGRAGLGEEEVIYRNKAVWLYKSTELHFASADIALPTRGPSPPRHTHSPDAPAALSRPDLAALQTLTVRSAHAWRTLV